MAHVKCFVSREEGHMKRDYWELRNMGGRQGTTIDNAVNVVEKNAMDVEAILYAIVRR